MPGNTDISHEVEARLVAIETRLDALDGGSTGDPKEEEEEEPATEEPVAASTRRGRRTYGASVEETPSEE